MSAKNRFTRARLGVLGLSLLAPLGIGCQVDVGGQTLPSPYYLSDDVQYFPAGPEFLLSNEAAAMRAANEQLVVPAVPAGMAPPGAGMVPPGPGMVPPPGPGAVPPPGMIPGAQRPGFTPPRQY